MFLQGAESLPSARRFGQHLRQDSSPGKLLCIPTCKAFAYNLTQPVLDILSDMVALDPSLNHVARFGGESASDDGLPAVGLD